MRILLVEPYYTGSHQAWADGYSRSSSHQVELLCLPGRFWKWRMHGGAVTLARRFRELDVQPDLILTTDMLDLTTFLALTRDLTHDVPTAIYFHENQLTYPMRRGEKRDLHYGFVNYASALVAHWVFFNSAYHKKAFFDELPRLLKHFPDYNELESLSQIRAKSQVLPLGLDLTRHDRYRPAEPRSGRPLILWNHRWEYDKNPKEFFNAVYAELSRQAGGIPGGPPATVGSHPSLWLRGRCGHLQSSALAGRRLRQHSPPRVLRDGYIGGHLLRMLPYPPQPSGLS
jgi:glycosyltransferase involved in cell wall biosynthesis